jgi:hypothetical protein
VLPFQGTNTTAPPSSRIDPPRLNREYLATRSSIGTSGKGLRFAVMNYMPPCDDERKANTEKIVGHMRTVWTRTKEQIADTAKLQVATHALPTSLYACMCTSQLVNVSRY